MNDIATCATGGADVNMVRDGIVPTVVSGVSSCIRDAVMVDLVSRKM